MVDITGSEGKQSLPSEPMVALAKVAILLNSKNQMNFDLNCFKFLT
jgi:hypothetical protein